MDHGQLDVKLTPDSAAAATRPAPSPTPPPIRRPTMATLGLAAAASGGATDPVSYDWDENYGKWRGVFVNPLFKVLKNLNDCLVADVDAMEYVESQLLKLLAILTAKPLPVTVSDVEVSVCSEYSWNPQLNDILNRQDRVTRTLPSLVEKRTLSQAQTALEKGKKKSNLILPLDKVHHMLKEVLQNNRLDDQVSLFLLAILEYISTDILKLAVDYVKNIHHSHITCQDVKVAMWADKVSLPRYLRALQPPRCRP